MEEKHMAGIYLLLMVLSLPLALGIIVYYSSLVQEELSNGK